MNQTIAAIATPSGEGSLCVLRLSGDQAVSILKRIFLSHSRKIVDLKPRRVYQGEIVHPDTQDVIDQVVVLFFAGPKSYTGEDVVEIFGHGGVLVAKTLLNLLLDQGARLADAGEFTRRAFLNGKIDLTQAEAIADLIHAQSDRAILQSTRQLKGQLKEAFETAYYQLLRILSQIETAIDFPEEGLEFEHKGSLAQEVSQVTEKIEEWIASFRQGKINREGFKIALIGKPNVGKSSLLNTLLSEDRAIVTSHPGTTRDILQEGLRIRDIFVQIIDTAGIRRNPDPVEFLGIERSLDMLQQADCAIALFDGACALDQEDENLIEQLLDRPKVCIVNKSDQPLKLDLKQLKDVLGVEEALFISAKEKSGIKELEELLYKLASEHLPPQDSLLITKERHRECLKDASDALKRAEKSLAQNLSEDLIAVDLNIAIDRLGSLLGKTFVEDLLDQIFADFCIGK